MCVESDRHALASILAQQHPHCQRGSLKPASNLSCSCRSHPGPGPCAYLHSRNKVSTNQAGHMVERDVWGDQMQWAGDRAVRCSHTSQTAGTHAGIS